MAGQDRICIQRHENLGTRGDRNSLSDYHSNLCNDARQGFSYEDRLAFIEQSPAGRRRDLKATLLDHFAAQPCNPKCYRRGRYIVTKEKCQPYLPSRDHVRLTELLAPHRTLLRPTPYRLRLAVAFAATDDKEFRHPRLAILDTVEDKGMEPERSRNFQNLLVAASRAAKVDHQIVFATAMIANELDDPAYTIGSFSSRDNRTLAI